MTLDVGVRNSRGTVTPLTAEAALQLAVDWQVRAGEKFSKFSADEEGKGAVVAACARVAGTWLDIARLLVELEERRPRPEPETPKFTGGGRHRAGDEL